MSSDSRIWKDLTLKIKKGTFLPFFRKGKLYKPKFCFGYSIKLMDLEDIEKDIYAPCMSKNFCYMFLGIYGRINESKEEEEEVQGEKMQACFKFLGPEGRSIYVPCYRTIEDFSRNYFDNEFEEVEEIPQ